MVGKSQAPKLLLSGKESTCNAGDLGSVPQLGRSPGEGNSYPLFWPGEFHGQRSLAGYIVHGVTKSQTQLRDFHFHLTEFRNGKGKDN